MKKGSALINKLWQPFFPSVRPSRYVIEDRLNVDDPVSIAATHLFPGVVGTVLSFVQA